MRQAKTPEDAADMGSLALAIKAFIDAAHEDAKQGLAATAEPAVPPTMAGDGDAPPESEAGQHGNVSVERGWE